MSRYTLFFNPMSRALIAKWAFAEVGVSPELAIVEWDAKPAALLAANPMGKLPTIIHHASEGDRVVTEASAICHYLAEMEASDLLPHEEEKADYFRWFFFAAGPIETAISNKAMGWEPKDAKQEGTVGFGSFTRVMDTLDNWFKVHDFVCGDRFTMADVYVGSQVDWGLNFGTMEARDSFKSYQQRIQTREAYRDSMGTIEG
ncbi:glutathione S-transferase-like [Aurantiacibacter atlanticus]|uniref:Glutathione S-transferase-like n=1 Tax=Aurantiacibacter atlanticus TaxID=1648404 RepID=A0A0H4VHU4_9SPHN|nr:glutathione S-transferase N-terminal domain-containing protein [Aurantiacibacter atlanticus]AKQ42471.1 glutathione S-transferase-like [Aurantiacibacter atlanticus]MDF1834134.1 glutathione S-transferase N-terminal domain-containing protein [Alteraurantiacibacter sp. bin_em_oilr2.035]